MLPRLGDELFDLNNRKLEPQAFLSFSTEEFTRNLFLVKRQYRPLVVVANAKSY